MSLEKNSFFLNKKEALVALMVKFQKKENKYWQVLVLLQHLRSEHVLSQTSLKIFFFFIFHGVKKLF